MTTTLSGHIEIDDDRIARVSGSKIKVIQLVMEKKSNGWGPEEVQRNFPHLSIAAIYAAFTYYYDHQGECDAQIAASEIFAEQTRRNAGPSLLAARLRSEGKIL